MKYYRCLKIAILVLLLVSCSNASAPTPQPVFTQEPEKIDHTIKFVLGLGSVDMVIVGFEDEKQLDNYMERTSSALKTLV